MCILRASLVDAVMAMEGVVPGSAIRVLGTGSAAKRVEDPGFIEAIVHLNGELPTEIVLGLIGQESAVCRLANQSFQTSVHTLNDTYGPEIARKMLSNGGAARVEDPQFLQAIAHCNDSL